VSQARATGDVTVTAGPWQVLGHYRPAARVAGDVWSCSDLGGGKLLVFAGDVVGRGVSSALVSAAVAGVCDAGPAVGELGRDPRGLLELAHKTVRDLGGGTQRVTAFAAVVDRERAIVRWASAGHRGAYLVKPPQTEEERARLEVLGGRSTPLGEPTLVLAEGERPLARDDHIIACSDGVVEVRDPRGEPWGDRRLQRLIRDQLISAGDRAARVAVAAAVAHAGEAAIADDMLVVVVRPAP
jgi:serine phosphatase RsbU (regulator of sigma subunit)